MGTEVILAALVAGGFLGYALGAYFGAANARHSVDAVRRQYDTLQRDFERISSANIRLLTRKVWAHHGCPVGGADERAFGGPEERERFLDLYDEAKRCLHRALDRHNARAERPIVIRRDGSNFIEALHELPEGSFGDGADDGGLREWIGQVFKLDAWRRGARAEPSPGALAAIEQERHVWATAIRRHLK
jgi:hypothetical protein